MVLLGWISPQDRTPAQRLADAHAKTLRVPFRLRRAGPPPVGTKVLLSQLWADRACVADMGMAFPGFRQLTGSCVGVSTGQAVCTLSCVQRKLATGPTKALIPFWGFAYGRTRFNEGDRGQGEGAVDSVAGATIHTEGTLPSGLAGLPAWDTSDGLALSENQELEWSDGGSATVTAWLPQARPNVVGGIATANSVEDVITGLLNGYPCLNGCDNYAGHGKLVGTGADAYVKTQYDGRGGHSTCFLDYWNHPTDGELLRYVNTWARDTYPADPNNPIRCGAWMLKSEAAKLFHSGGSGGETLLLSHLSYFPAQPEVLDWYV